MSYSRQDAVDSVREAADQLGHSPSQTEYREIGLSPSLSTIRQRLGGWDSVKREAGLTLCEAGVEPKYNVDINYFSSIDSPEKAYWLGVLFGDGWITSNSNGTRVVGLGLQEKTHIQRFREAISSDHPIEENSGIYRIRIGRQDLADDLAEVGFDSDKTTSSVLPDLLGELKPHFVRGLSDADGTFVENTDCRGFTWSLCGSSKGRFDAISSWLPVEAGLYEREDGCYDLQVSNREAMSLLTEWLYPEGTDTTPALPRKMALAHF
jgi:hypothetical protein